MTLPLVQKNNDFCLSQIQSSQSSFQKPSLVKEYMNMSSNCNSKNRIQCIKSYSVCKWVQGNGCQSK